MPTTARECPAIQCAVHLYPIDGAVQRVGADDTAFAYRDVDFSPVIAGMWEDPADNEANIAWVRAYYEALEPFSAEGGYVNFMDADDQGRITANYRGNYDRLAAIKATYDPTNLFHLNQNIQPATETTSGGREHEPAEIGFAPSGGDRRRGRGACHVRYRTPRGADRE